MELGRIKWNGVELCSQFRCSDSLVLLNIIIVTMLGNFVHKTIQNARIDDVNGTALFEGY